MQQYPNYVLQNKQQVAERIAASQTRMYGVTAFGEIAYQLLNRTLVYLEIKDVKK